MIATIPDDQVVYAIGDIHGSASLLTGLLASIEQDAAAVISGTKALIFLGDYVDRGPDSRDVIEILSAGLPSGFDTHFLKGNHEQLLLDFLDDPTKLDAWLRNGGGPTLLSYGVDVDGLVREHADPTAWRDAFLGALSETHLRFLGNLKLKCQIGDYVFVHAGVRPGVPLDEQLPVDLLWIRQEFLQSQGFFEKMVVHGHSPEREPVLRSNRIGIDTGAVFTGRLTALRLEAGKRAFLHAAH